ncbi:MAG: hypothetical protein RL514_4415 [Verrucomicrobiota bacterium]
MITNNTQIEPLADPQTTYQLLLNAYGPWLRPRELMRIFKSESLARRVVRAGWLQPVVQGNRFTAYRLTDALACMARMEAGQMP